MEPAAGTTTPSPGRPWPLALLLAGLACVAHYLMVDVPQADFQRAWHQRIVSNQGPYPDQYRVLTYALAEGLIRLGVPFALAHELLRFVFTALALVLLHRCIEHWLPRPWPVVGVLLAAAILPSTYLYYDMQPTDPLNWLLFCAAFLALQRGRDGWLVPIVALGALNRETVLLLPPLHALVRVGLAPRRRWLPVTLLSAAAGAAVYLGLRLLLGSHEPYAETSVRHFWRTNLFEKRAHLQLLIFFNLALLFAWRRFGSRPEFLRRSLWLLPALLAVHTSVGYLRETRLMLPVLPALLPLTLMGIRDWRQRAARPPKDAAA